MMLLADESVDKPIVDALRSAGFNVFYVLEVAPGTDDATVLHLSNQEQRVLLTQDKDFGELVFRLRNVHYGVVLVRLPGYTPSDKAALVMKLLLQHQAEITKAFTVIQPNAIRIRK